MEKITYITALNFAIENLTDAPAEIVDKLTALRDQTAKRNSAERKPTKKQVENAGLTERVLAVLAIADRPMTVTEIMGEDDTLAVLSNQKVSALVNALVEEHKAVKITEKRKSYFTKA